MVDEAFNVDTSIGPGMDASANVEPTTPACCRNSLWMTGIGRGDSATRTCTKRLAYQHEEHQHSPGPTLAVWLPTSAASTPALCPPPPKRQNGGRKCTRPKPTWYKCADFVQYLEDVAKISFEEAFQVAFEGVPRDTLRHNSGRVVSQSVPGGFWGGMH